MSASGRTERRRLGWLPLRGALSLAGVAAVTWMTRIAAPMEAAGNAGVSGIAITAALAYLLMVLVIASTWGFVEALVASLAATLTLNFFFFPPVGTLSIAAPQNWIALFSFLATSLIASRLSTKAEQRARDAMDRQQDIERLYAFSRAILLIEEGDSFPRELARRVVEAFAVRGAVLHDHRTGEKYAEGASEVDDWAVIPVRMGADEVATLSLANSGMGQAVLQGIGNLVAIGLERARAHDLARQVEAARESEQLRTTLIDAMAHEFKTPLTSIKAATTALLASPDQPRESTAEMLTIADEEADHLRQLIDDAVEMARLDSTHIDVALQMSNLDQMVREVIASMRGEVQNRTVEVACDSQLPAIPIDRRLVKLALKQLIDNALKYSPPGTPVRVRAFADGGRVAVEVIDGGAGIPAAEQLRIFDRFYRSPSVKQRIPGSGLGLSIAHSIMQAHNGVLKVSSRPGETKFQMTFPVDGVKH